MAPKRRGGFWLKLSVFVLAALIPAAVVLGFRQGIYPSGETTNDSYYHVAMADLGPSTFLAKQFPYLTLSIWNQEFSDKELGFHAYLWVVRSAERLLGLDMEPPFHFADFFVCLLAFGGMAFACWRMRVHPLVTLLAVTGSAVLTMPFLFRAMMLRPHMLAIGLMTASCGLYAAGSFRFKLVAAFLVSFAFTWSYSNPHFIIIPALAFGVALYGEYGRKALLIPALAAAGFVAGLVIHPQFPNSLLMWKVQSVDAVLRQIIMDDSPLSKPAEFMKPNARWFLLTLPLLALLYFELMALVKMKERFGLAGIPAHVKALALLAGLFAVASLLAVRAVEYACPFACLLAAALCEEWRLGRLPVPVKFKVWPAVASAVAALLLFSAIDWGELTRTTKMPWNPCPGMNAWLKCNVPKDSVVVNMNWGDFPMLFYSIKDYRFIWGIDPMFSYIHDRRKAMEIDAICRQRPYPEDWKLRDATGADYAAVLIPSMAKSLMVAGWKVAYEGPDGWLFALDRH